MLKFIVGLVFGVLVVFLGGYCYVRGGFVDPRADTEVGLLEKKMAMPSLDAALDRHAPEAQNPI